MGYRSETRALCLQFEVLWYEVPAQQLRQQEHYSDSRETETKNDYEVLKILTTCYRKTIKLQQNISRKDLNSMG
uniref:Uncharacterized protein n=1 Tax=Setaria digitata TaxID=48799 RepID=A0A915Q2C3_9BILA